MTRGFWLAWLAAVAVCFGVYWQAFDVWFLMDDFAWLGLKQEIDAGGGLAVLFEPRAQGTVRLFSERLYFFGLSSIFGIDPLPFRLIAFGCQLAVLWLLVRIAAFLGGTWMQALAAGVVYAASAHLARPLMWAASFNQILASLCLLLAFWFLLRGRWWAQYAVYLVWFGVLETAVVYPALATLYCWLFAREQWRRTLWLWPPALLFVVLHLFVIPRPSGNEYAAVYDLGMLASLGEYSWMAAGAFGVALLGWAVWRAAKERDFLPLYFAAWFVVLLAPVLPLQNRISGYYLALPLTGVALLAGTVRGRVAGMVELAVCAGYVWMSASAARPEIDFFLTASQRIQNLLENGSTAARAKGADTVLLSGIDTELFNTGLQDTPFRLYGLNKVYLVPGSESGIRARADLGGVSAYKISQRQAVEALESGKTIVLSIAGDRVSDATNRYRSVILPQYVQSRPRSINLGETAYESLLGPGWWPVEGKFRWMAKTASLRIGAEPGDRRVRVTGFCPETVIAQGPVSLTVASGSTVLGTKRFEKVDAFDWRVDLPPGLSRDGWLPLTFSVDRATRVPGDKRDLGLIWGTVSLQQ
ncbi:hypothetical protein F183_A48760 [Bryobacterales bacterium F-183]|nr:hypothetical protein F183_A48760 [Bryobacterales bacterium F-183]